MRKSTAITAAVVAAGLVLGACGGSASNSSSTKPKSATSRKRRIRLSVRSVPGLGRVLANAQGRTLYVFARDQHRKVTCVRSCASVWPPVKLRKGQKAVASGKVKRSLLGSHRDPEGGRVVTYDHWPLYTYVYDTTPGSAGGQALKANGGLWYALSPSGHVIHKKPPE